MFNVVLVGCGFMGRMHGTVYGLLDGAQLVAAVDHKADARAAYADKFGVPTYETLEEALAAHDVHVVDICLPTDLHRAFTEKAAAAEKHVLCEKPMALTVADAEAMKAACAEAGVQLMIGHCIRFWPEYALLKQLVDDGSLGKLRSVNLTRYGQFPSWSSDNWLASEARSGGGVLDMHIHDSDFAHFLLGDPDEVVAFGTVDGRGPSHVFSTMRFGDAIVHLEGGWNLPPGAPFKMAFRAIFERGAALFDAGPMTVYADGKEPWEPEFPKMEAAGGGNISDLGGYYHEIRYFIDRLTEGKPLETVTPDSSIRSLKTTLEEIRQIKAKA